jgi:hypothetical protein
MFNALRKERTEQVSYPVSFTFNKEKYTASGNLPTEIPILIKGSGWQILRKMFHLRIMPVEIELSPEYQMKRPFFLKHELTRETEKVLENVRLEDILIDTLVVRMDYKYKRVLRLVVDSAKLMTNTDYRIVSPIKIFPEYVAIVGPKNFVKNLPNPYPIDIDKEIIKPASKQFNNTLPIQIKGISKNQLQQDETNVRISFDIERFVQKSLNTPIEVKNGQNARKINVPINYTVRETWGEQVRENDFVLEIDWTDYDKKTGTASLRLKKCPTQVSKEDVFFMPRLKVD